MNNRYEEAIVGYRAEIIAAATNKLGRELTTKERAGIERIGSLMMLESVYRSLTFETYSADKVESDLRFFASQSA